MTNDFPGALTVVRNGVVTHVVPIRTDVSVALDRIAALTAECDRPDHAYDELAADYDDALTTIEPLSRANADLTDQLTALSQELKEASGRAATAQDYAEALITTGSAAYTAPAGSGIGIIGALHDNVSVSSRYIVVKSCSRQPLRYVTADPPNFGRGVTLCELLCVPCCVCVGNVKSAAAAALFSLLPELGDWWSETWSEPS